MYRFIILGAVAILLIPQKTIINKIETTILNKNIIPLITKNYKGSIIIDKINLNGSLLDINDPNNNIDNNITIKDIDENINYFLIMAHSGTGPKAFFSKLKYLNIGDKITINYNNIQHTYYVTNIERQEKNGTISIKKDQNTLVLTTCDNPKQLIIYAKK